MSMRRNTPGYLDGAKWRRSHQATVDTVLTSLNETRKVHSRGTRFFNTDSWTARTFVAALCEWARLNPGSTPKRRDVVGWVVEANRCVVHYSQKGITIAATPDDLPRWKALALVGGCYHEAWHTLYSRRTPIHITEVWPKVADLWERVSYAPAEGHMGWAPLTGALLEWGNVIEDIRIERVGCVEFPGTPSKMEALQDLILKMEATLRESDAATALTVTVSAFRDLGLGYTTPDQAGALKTYQGSSPDAWDLVEKGPLRPLLDRTMALDRHADLDHLWLAMEVVATIVEAAQPPEEEEKGEGEEGEGEGEPEKADSPPAPPKQLEASDFGEDGGEAPPTSKPILYKKGDRALLTVGPHTGREVEVTLAGLPHPETGIQELEFALVET
jgi:hypothetical protein